MPRPATAIPQFGHPGQECNTREEFCNISFLQVRPTKQQPLPHNGGGKGGALWRLQAFATVA